MIFIFQIDPSIEMFIKTSHLRADFLEKHSKKESTSFSIIFIYVFFQIQNAFSKEASVNSRWHHFLKLSQKRIVYQQIGSFCLELRLISPVKCYLKGKTLDNIIHNRNWNLFEPKKSQKSFSFTLKILPLETSCFLLLKLNEIWKL